MWWQVASTVIGLALMAAPSVVGYGDPGRTQHWILGPIAASLACVAIWEVARGLRRANALVAAWLVVAPLVQSWSGGTTVSIAAGVALAVCALVPSPVSTPYGGGWRMILVGERRDGSR